VEELRRSLEKVGVYVEQCTSWYSAVYPMPGQAIGNTSDLRVWSSK
jgi:hypothetical protein